MSNLKQIKQMKKARIKINRRMAVINLILLAFMVTAFTFTSENAMTYGFIPILYTVCGGGALKNLGRRCKVGTGEVIGVLISDSQQSIAQADAESLATYTALMSASGTAKLQYLPVSMEEITNTEKVTETLKFGMNIETSITNGIFALKFANPSVGFRKNFLKSFIGGKDIYFALVFASGFADFIENGTNFTLRKAHAMSNKEEVTASTAEKVSLMLQPYEPIFDDIITYRVIDLSLNTDADFYFKRDFYATQDAETTVSSDSTTSSIIFTATSNEGFAISGLVKADIILKADGVDISSEITTVVESTTTPGTYTITPTAAPFTTGAITVETVAEASLTAVTGFDFVTFNAYTIS